MLKTLKMDLLGIRPYITWKLILFFVLFSVGFTYFGELSFFPLVFAMTMSLMIMTYPFVTGEDSGTERLYRMIGMEDEDTVRGRYLYSLVVFFAVGHKKAKGVAGGALIATTGIVIAVSGFAASAFPNEVKALYHWAMSHLLFVVLGAVLLIALLTALSYTIALRKFKKRDL